MFVNLNAKIKVRILCVEIICLVLLFISTLKADEITKLEGDFNRNGSQEIALLVREINSNLSTQKNKFGRERLEIYCKDNKKLPIFVSQWFDYTNREEVIRAEGMIKLVNRENLPCAIAYIHASTGVGTGGETYRQKYYLYGWNGISYGLLFKEEIHNRKTTYPRHYADEWQPGSYKEIIKQLDFIDLDGDGVKDIVVRTRQRRVSMLQKTPSSKEIEIPKQLSAKFLRKKETDKFYWKEGKYLKRH